MKYFQTDDRDDYFASLSKEKKPRIKATYSVFRDENIILKKIRGYNGITFTKTLCDLTRKELSNNNWIKVLEQKGYKVKLNC